MKGYFRKRGTTWSYTVDIGRDELTGKRKQKSKSGFKTKKEAMASCNELIHQLNTGMFVEQKEITVQELLGHWMDLQQDLKRNTVANYKRAINNQINPLIGHISITKIKPIEIERFYKELKDKGYSSSTRAQVHVILKNAFKKAMKWEYLIKNPLEHVTGPAVRTKQSSTWTFEQIQTFLKTANDCLDEYKVYYTYFLLALHSGLRRGEISALMWEDIDFKEGLIRVNKSLNYDPDDTSVYFIDEPKTLSSKRRVTVDESVLDELKKWKVIQNRAKLLLGTGFQDQGFIFTRPDGQPIHHVLLRYHFKKIIKKSGVPDIRLHDLRHTHVTLLLELGESLKVISERVGHSSIAITGDVYSHVTPQMQKSTAKKFGEAMRKESM